MTNDVATVRVTHHFAASAERVFDAFLDPAKAGRFLFATPTGQIVRCQIDPRVGGSFRIVDRRDGEEIAHTGTYQEIDRPRRLVFTLQVERYGPEIGRVAIDIVPRPPGCELTLTHELGAAPSPDLGRRTEEGWAAILDVAGELLVDEAPTCGVGLAQHATIPSKIGVMFGGLAATLELHRKMLVPGDEKARREDEVYRDLAARWRAITIEVEAASRLMAAQRELPMGRHDQAAWGEEHRRAFETFVQGQNQLLGLLRVAAPRDQEMLRSMKR